MTHDNPRSDEILMAREIDTRIAAAFEAFYVMRIALDVERNTIAKYEKMQKKSYLSPREKERYQTWSDQTQGRIDKLEPRVAELKADAEKLNSELYGGWPRFFLVQHIHKSMHCSSFRPTTRIGWLPAVSGLTEAEAVAEYGATLCTICFPDAPTELTVARVDPKVCTGVIDRSKPNGLQYYKKWATCSECGQRVSVTSAFKLRKHNK